MKKKLVCLSMNCKKLFNISIEKLYSYILLSGKETAISKKQFNQVVLSYGNKTGYEASNNKRRIIDFFDSPITAHFHQSRKNEGIFFGEDLYQFIEPVGVLMSDERHSPIIEDKEVD